MASRFSSEAVSYTSKGPDDSDDGARSTVPAGGGLFRQLFSPAVLKTAGVSLASAAIAAVVVLGAVPAPSESVVSPPTRDAFMAQSSLQVAADPLSPAESHAAAPAAPQAAQVGEVSVAVKGASEVPPPVVQKPTVVPRPAHIISEFDYHHDCKCLEPNGGAAEWSRDRYRHQHCKEVSEGIAALKASPTPKDARRTLLFVDAREECERYREFLLKVRRTGYGGDIVFMVYYGGDAERCRAAGIETDFAPLSIHYHPAPRWEVTLFQYHGVTSYFRANPSALLSYEVAAAVRPDYVEWCSSPFEQIPPLTPLPTGDAVPADEAPALTRKANRTVFTQMMHDPRFKIVVPEIHFSSFHQQIVNDDLVVGAPVGLNFMMSRVIQHAESKPRIITDPSWATLWLAPALARFRARNLRPLSSIDPSFENLYDHRSCHAPRCGPREKGVRTQDRHCFKGHEGDTIAYSPFCYMTYRGAVSEVPRDGSISLENVAEANIIEGIHAIKNAQPGSVNDVYSSPSAEEVRSRVAAREWGGFSDRCPHGKMAVLSMVGSYGLGSVRDFLGAYLHSADPHCTRLVLMLKWAAVKDARRWETEIGEVATNHTPRIELVVYTESDADAAAARGALSFKPNEWSNRDDARVKTGEMPVINLVEVRDYRGRTYVDLRFEVAREWLERNYKDYRYASNIDSRDLIITGDPLKQVVRVLNNSRPVDGSAPSYLGEEFIGAVSEFYPLGSFTTFNEWASYWAPIWVSPCGPQCFPYLTRQSFTNGEPLAIINSGSLIGTTIGLLKYYRMHVRMTTESKWQFTHSDQGIFTFYYYAALADTKYPHRILALHSSRSGFANPVHFDKITRRKAAGATEYEYAMEDCLGQRVVQIHQADRDPRADNILRSSPWIKDLSSPKK